MKIALLAITTVSLACSAGSLTILVLAAREAKRTKDRLEAEVESLRVKVAHNAKVLKAALGAMTL